MTDYRQFKLEQLKREVETLKLYCGCLIILFLTMAYDAIFMFIDQPVRASLRAAVGCGCCVAIYIQSRMYKRICNEIEHIEKDPYKEDEPA